MVPSAAGLVRQNVSVVEEHTFIVCRIATGGLDQDVALPARRDRGIGRLQPAEVAGRGPVELARSVNAPSNVLRMRLTRW